MFKCPLCRKKYESLDYHHWCYDPDVGCRFCRGCHKRIHNNQRVREQRVEAEDRGYYGWIFDALERLVVAEFKHHPECRVVVESRRKHPKITHPFEDWDQFRDHILRRYNVPNGDRCAGRRLPEEYRMLSTNGAYYSRGSGWLGQAQISLLSLAGVDYDFSAEARAVCDPSI